MNDDSGVDNRTGQQRKLDALDENRASTQFGGARANPQCQDVTNAKPWSIKHSIRYSAAIELSEGDEDLTQEELMRKLLPKKRKAAEMIAARQVAKSIKGDQAATENVIEQIDGKVASIGISATLKDLEGKSDDELERIALGKSVLDSSAGAEDSGRQGRETGASSGQDAPDGEALPAGSVPVPIPKGAV